MWRERGPVEESDAHAERMAAIDEALGVIPPPAAASEGLDRRQLILAMGGEMG